MTFVQLAYLGFLPAVLLVYWALPSTRAQNVLLAITSAVFYGWVHPWFLLLLYASTLIDYGVGLGMARWPGRRNLLLGLSLVGNLGLLGTFKYFDFFAGAVAAAGARLGLHLDPPLLRLLLPAGISFYTFQSLSYSIDIWRGRLEPRRDLLAFVVFVSLFPQLVAGPIERARDLLAHVESPRRFSWESLGSGLGLCLRGALLKVVVADNVALYVDRILDLEHPSFPLVWVAMLGFSVQILGDFGGYTLLARGSARMLGFELQENFHQPYSATSPADFWRRWHISFSSWIHDYLYRPLRGERPGPLRRTLATFASLLASGLWHGASWNFVLWGGYHALILVLHRGWQALRPAPLPRPLAIALMFPATVLGWLFFRERDLGRILDILRLSPFAASAADWTLARGACAVVLAGAGLLWLSGTLRVPAGTRLGPALRGLGWAAAIGLLLLFSRDNARAFLYFRF